MNDNDEFQAVRGTLGANRATLQRGASCALTRVGTALRAAQPSFEPSPLCARLPPAREGRETASLSLHSGCGSTRAPLGIGNPPMTPETQRVLRFFDEYIFGFMRNDIDAAIRGKANFLAALGLVSYTEVLGGLVTGNAGGKRVCCRKLSRLFAVSGKRLQALETKGVDLYDTVRCGLVHQYFIKGGATIWMNANAPCGIFAGMDAPTYFIVNVYRDHFFAGAARYRNELIDATNAVLRANFESGARAIGFKDWGGRVCRAWHVTMSVQVRQPGFRRAEG